MLRKFDENVKLLVERMNEQIKSRRMYYARELHAIEDAFMLTVLTSSDTL